MDIVFLTLDEIIRIHQDQIKHYGGNATIRDLNLLESAVSMPKTTFDGQFVHHDLFEMAAAYLFHIVQNHPFIDGNKRTGTVATLVFLALNQIEIDVDNDLLADFVLAVAQGHTQKSAIAEFLRKHTA